MYGYVVHLQWLAIFEGNIILVSGRNSETKITKTKWANVVKLVNSDYKNIENLVYRDYI